MADLADVEQALTDLVISTIYPAGPTQASIIGSQCRIYRGWPVAAGLNADLTAGVVNVTVSPDEEPGRTTTRYLPKSLITPNVSQTSIAVHDNMIIIGGTPAYGDVVGILINGTPYVYRILPTDTTSLIASQLATAVGSQISITQTGSSIIVNEPAKIIARAVSDGLSTVENRRQEKSIRIISWCPDPMSRDAIAVAIDRSLAATSFLLINDGSSARLVYKDTSVYDQSQNANLYRRDLIYLAEYATVSVQSLPSMLFGDAVIGGNAYYG